MTQASQTLLWVTSNCRQPQNTPCFLNLCVGKQQQLEFVAMVSEVFRHHNSGCHRCPQAQKMLHRELPLYVKPLFHFHVSGVRLQGMSCSEGDFLSKLETIKDRKSRIFFSLLFRKRWITENNVSQQGHLALGREDGGFGALLWTSSGTSEPHEHSRWQSSGSTQEQGHWKALGYGFVVKYPRFTVCISSKSPYGLITREIPLNTAGKYLILGINMAARPIHTAVL